MKFSEPDYTYWDGVHSLTERQVICLWIEAEPSTESSKSVKALEIKKRLAEAREQGQLLAKKKRKNVNGKSVYRLWYRRQSLKEYAELIHEKPAFLFRENRFTDKAIALKDNFSPLKSTTNANRLVLRKSTLHNLFTSNAKTIAVPVTKRQAKTKDEKHVAATPCTQEKQVDTTPITTFAPNVMGQATPSDQNIDAEPNKCEKRIRIIENFADELGYTRLAIPRGGKAKLMKKCLQERNDIFLKGEDPFLEAWKKASKSRRIQIIDRQKYLSR